VARGRAHDRALNSFRKSLGHEVEIDTRRLVQENAVQWQKDLVYSGRARAAPERVRCISRLAGVQLESYPRYELRVVEVEPATDGVIPFRDGWPN
jgi:hypothetical protein